MAESSISRITKTAEIEHRQKTAEPEDKKHKQHAASTGSWKHKLFLVYGNMDTAGI